jgi:hypothetical protein
VGESVPEVPNRKPLVRWPAQRCRAVAEPCEQRAHLSAVPVPSFLALNSSWHPQSLAGPLPAVVSVHLDPAYTAGFSQLSTDASSALATSPAPASPLTAAPGPGATFDAANFETNSTNTGGFVFIPPDTSAAAGPANIVNVVNASIEWYTKSGVKQNSQKLGTAAGTSVAGSFFASLMPANFLFDPKVMYDQYNGRFVVVALEKVDNGAGAIGNSSRILIAVSQTSDPTAGWYFTAVTATTTVGTTASYLDYPGLAVDANAIYVTGNLYGFGGGTFQGSRLFIINKAGFYTGGGPASVVEYDPSALAGIHDGNGQTIQAFSLQPSEMFGTAQGTTGVFLVSSGWLAGDGVTNLLSVIRVDSPLSASPVFTNQFVSLGVIASSGAAFAIPQPGTTYTLDGGDTRITSAVWRNNTLWAANTINPTSTYDATNAGQATIHWYKIDTTTLSALALSDQGDVGGEDIAAGASTFYPAITVDSSGNMGLGFSAASATTYAGAYYTGRKTTDAAGTVEGSVAAATGVDYYVRTFGSSYGSGRNRWGDYSSIALDPADGQTFWVYNEYALARGSLTSNLEDGRWGTKLARFIFATGSISGQVYRDNFANGVKDGTDTPIGGVTVYLDANGSDLLDPGESTAVTDANGNYTFANVVAGTYSVRQVMPAGYVQVTPASFGANSVTVTTSAVTGANFGDFPIAYSAASGGTAFTVGLDTASPQDVQISVNGTLTNSAPRTLISSLAFTGGVGNDSLTVDFTNGNVVPTGGISYDGGAGTDGLTILGTSANDSVAANASTITLANVTFSSAAISYANLETISVDPKAGNDTLTQSAQPGNGAALVFLNSTTSDTLAVIGGTYTVPAPAAGAGIVLAQFNQVTIGAGAKMVMATAPAHADRTLLYLNTLSIAGTSNAWTGTLDLGGNDMFIHGTGLTAQPTISNQVASGYNAGGTLWAGKGITSSVAANDPQHLRAIGILLNATLGTSPVAFYGTGKAKGLFDGQNATTTDLLVKSTYFGDADLDGSVTAADYALTDYPHAYGGTGWWSGGNFDYNGTMNAADYTLLDNAYLTQGPRL